MGVQNPIHLAVPLLPVAATEVPLRNSWDRCCGKGFYVEREVRIGDF